MTIGLILPGGTTLGATQVPGIERFAPHVAWVVGGSVGTANGTFVGMGRTAELRPIWQDVGQTGTRWFQKLHVTWGIVPKFWDGLFQLDPLRAKLKAHRVGVNGYRIPTYAGVVHSASSAYFSLSLNDLSLSDQHDAIVCSCLQPGIHRPESFRGRRYVDAGVRNVIPQIPQGVPKVDEVVVLCCSPIEEEHRFPKRTEEQVSSGFEQAQAAVQTFMGEIVLGDVKARIEEARALGAKRITFYAPKTWDDVGKPFEATQDTIALRLRTGATMLEAPRVVVDL